MKSWEVLKAVDEGKTVQWRYHDADYWKLFVIDSNVRMKDLEEALYRIKPEPIIKYMNVYSRANGSLLFGTQFDTREEALKAHNNHESYIRTAKLVEELE